MIAQEFIDSGYPITTVLECVKVSRSRYYYHSKQTGVPRGIKVSTRTRKAGGEWVDNEEVVKDIEEILGQEFVDYGYIKVTYWLRKVKGYIINKKKVYRLMHESGLLNTPSRSRQKIKKEWVKELVPQPSRPLEYLEMDIKYIYVHGMGRSAFLLSVIDVDSRWILGQKLSWKMKQEDVIEIFDKIFETYDLPKKMYIRNDNGSQFAAQFVQEYFFKKEILQEFTKPATPEQNAHIESFHSILEKVICRRYQFSTIKEARETLNRFLEFYNLERIHSGIGYQSPQEYLKSKNIKMNDLIESKLLIA